MSGGIKIVCDNCGQTMAKSLDSRCLLEDEWVTVKRPTQTSHLCLKCWKIAVEALRTTLVKWREQITYIPERDMLFEPDSVLKEIAKEKNSRKFLRRLKGQEAVSRLTLRSQGKDEK